MYLLCLITCRTKYDVQGQIWSQCILCMFMGSSYLGPIGNEVSLRAKTRSDFSSPIPHPTRQILFPVGLSLNVFRFRVIFALNPPPPRRLIDRLLFTAVSAIFSGVPRCWSSAYELLDSNVTVMPRPHKWHSSQDRTNSYVKQSCNTK